MILQAQTIDIVAGLHDFNINIRTAKNFWGKNETALYPPLSSCCFITLAN